mmetsp:Transcript_1049/g.2755  ORF Transcript_1049/g.2755 Transcript_1049/m.2755 type:complete len:228 (-) Transcript_1049:175-858(-)
MRPMTAVFHLLAILVKVVDPELMRICRTRFSKAFIPSLSTRRNACAVRSLVASFCRLHTPSLCAKPSACCRHLGRIRTSKPAMENSRLGLSRLYTLTKLFSHSNVVRLRGSRFLMSQKVARPRLTSCFMSRIRASRGQHLRLLYPTMFSLLGSGCSVRYLWMRSLASSSRKRSSMYTLSTYRQYRRMGCRVSVRVSRKHMKSLGWCGGPAISEARERPRVSRSTTRP